MELGNELMGVTDWMPAAVPGGVHADLYRAGLLSDPYFGMNSLQCEWVENRWWVYRAALPVPIPEGERIELVFKGLDYEAMVLLNGVCLGEHKGMFHPAVFDITSLVRSREPLELFVVFKQAPDEMGQIGKTSETFTQKSRFNYKWDFSTRLVNVGIWDDVVLRVRQACSLDDVRIWTDVEAGEGVIRISVRVQSWSPAGSRLAALHIRVEDPAGATVYEERTAEETGRRFERSIRLDSPQLWYPNGYGSQPLYRVELRLLQDDRLMDEQSYRVGVRSLSYRRNEGSPEEALPYTFVVNGEAVYVKGANLTPLDHLYGNVADARYEWIVLQAKHANLNMLRIWGGGLIEKPRLYELCDEHGILIWQEFIQSSSGIDNVPSKKPAFLALLRETAAAALRGRRNHVSLAVWSGGNELMSEPNKPSTCEDENLRMLRTLVDELDPGRLFLPTSASGPVQYITAEKGVSHDIHGHWVYQGNPAHYAVYRETDNLFHSEFGVDGLSAYRSLRKFLDTRHLRPVSMRDDLVWRHHGEWWDTYDRDTAMFGPMDRLPVFAACSQWIQAEGLRFILEANRRRQFRNSGSLVWQLNEPWPNVSCTNLVDYYGEPKMAYYWARQAFAPLHASLDYATLTYAAGDMFRGAIYLHDQRGETAGSVVTEVLDSRGRVHVRQFDAFACRSNGSRQVGELAYEVPCTDDGLIFVRLTVETRRDRVQGHPYVFSLRQEQPYGPARRLPAPALQVVPQGEWRQPRSDGAVWVRAFDVRNTGDFAALHVHPAEEQDAYWILADDAYFSLFPGESRTVVMTCRRREGELFPPEGGASGETSLPVIRFHSFSEVEGEDDP